MASQTPIGSTKIPVALPFGTLGIGNANGTLHTQIASVLDYRMPIGGWVVGFSVNMTGTLNTGTLTFAATKNGAVMSNTFAHGTVNIGTLGNHERDVVQPGFAFAEGDTIGLMFAKTGTVEPTTNDATALVIVLLDQYNY